MTTPTGVPFGVTRDGAGADQLAAARRAARAPACRCCRRPLARPADRPTPARARAAAPATRARRSARLPGARLAVRLHPVDLDHADAAVGDRRGDRALQRREIAGRRSPGPAASRRCRVAWLGNGCLAIAIVGAGDRVRRGQHLRDRNAEPALGRLANQLAADQQHQDRRHDRQAEQRRHQLQPEARERQAAPPLDNQLDDVARQHEREREQHRRVGDGERVEDDLAEEVGIELGGAIGQRDHRDQADQQQDDSGEDQPRVVAERTPFTRRRQAPASRRHGRTRLEIADRGTGEPVGTGAA